MANTMPTKSEAIMYRLPDNDEPGSKTIAMVPSVAMAIPVFSRRVTRSCKKAAPVAETMMGYRALMMLPSRAVVFS